MNIKEEITKLKSLAIGFDMSIAELKYHKVVSLVDYVENLISIGDLSVGRSDIISVLQEAYGIIYELGLLKQSLPSHDDFLLVERIMPLARIVYGKSKELLPYLHLHLNYNIGNKKKYRLINQEIGEIANL